MKFAKGLEENIVPEWRVKYIDYKGGKKRIKDVAKAIKYAEASPAVNSLYINTLLNRAATEPSALPAKPKGKGGPNSRFKWISSLFSTAPTYPIPTVAEFSPTEDPSGGIDTPLAGAARQLKSLPTGQVHDALTTTQYGTISSPSEGTSGVPVPPPSLQLPEPMQPLCLNNGEHEARSGKIRHIPGGPDISITKRKLFPFHKNKGLTSFSMANSRPASLKRASIVRIPGAAVEGKVDDIREEAIEDFFRWLEAELRKIDTFYRIKEDEAARRLEELREQLPIMRDMRSAEIRTATRAHSSNIGGHKPNGGMNVHKHKPSHSWNPVGDSFVPVPSPTDRRKAPALPRVGPASSQPLTGLGGHPPAGFTSNRESIRPNTHEHRAFFRQMTPGLRDYAVHRKPMNEITYRVAKRKLKVAMIEYYRGLELLKLYCHQNQEGLRKIIKKFDKATGLRTSKRFTTEKISRSYFGSSDVLETLIHQTEDLFSRYFERGDRKHAVERLRTREKSREFYGSTFRSGILLGLGAFAMIQGMIAGLKSALGQDEAFADQSSYLLQIWAGFFLALFSMLLFALNCQSWVKNKINYVFCFEFDTRHNLDYHQLAELPALLWFLMCVIFWLNFENHWPNNIHYIHYPMIFLALCLGIVFAPFPILYHRSRRWFVYSHWRLLLSGLYPVEFRDFWLGDMYCSLTYTMGNIALISCLYNGNWDTPGKCNSSHSRLLGFFSCLPGIWRFLQCLRRYRDTGNAFPHLANAGKYACTIMYFVSLSLWRIGKTEESKALFIAFGTVNAVYCSTWDIAMDWSLLNPYAAWPFLRQEMAFKRPIIYYIAMIVDSLLRFNWIFYVIFARNIQHSTIVSFLISLSEVFRRWIWAYFRMENEHCTNVATFRAYREVPLPYELPPPTQTSSLPPGRVEEDPNIQCSTSLPKSTVGPGGEPQAPSTTPSASGHRSSFSAATLTANSTSQQRPTSTLVRDQSDLEGQPTPIPGFRYRGRPASMIQCRESEVGTPTMRALSAMGSALARAHTQDFERRKSRPESGRVNTDDEEDEDDDDDDDSSHASEDEGQVSEGASRGHLSNMTEYSIRSRGTGIGY